MRPGSTRSASSVLRSSARTGRWANAMSRRPASGVRTAASSACITSRSSGSRAWIRSRPAPERQKGGPVQEAPLEDIGSGLAPSADGWFIVNVRDAAWYTSEAFGSATRFEGPNAAFRDLGINIRVLPPGKSNCLYHAESPQEAFLVLAGEGLLLV